MKKYEPYIKVKKVIKTIGERMDSKLKRLNSVISDHLALSMIALFLVVILVVVLGVFNREIRISTEEITVAITTSEGYQQVNVQEAMDILQNQVQDLKTENGKLHKNMSFQAVYDIRNIPAQEVINFKNKVKAETGSLYVPMFAYEIPYGKNNRFPLTIDEEEYEWVYDVKNRPLITFANMRFEHNVIGEFFIEKNPDWAQRGEKYNVVVPGMVGYILTSHWAVILDYIPEGEECTYLHQKIDKLAREWNALQVKYNPGVKDINFVFE